MDALNSEVDPISEKNYQDSRKEFADLYVHFLNMSELKVEEETGKKIAGKFLKDNEKEILLNMNLEDLNDLAEEVKALEAAKKKWECSKPIYDELQ